MRYRTYCFLFFISLSFPGFAQEKAKNTSVKKLTDEISALGNSPEMKHASWGISIVNVSTGNSIAQYNSNQSLKPASTLKILTTASALSLLGENFHFQTSLEYDGTIGKDGVLNGNIYIKGGGDPSLSSELFPKVSPDSLEVIDHWVSVIQKAGITSIKGRIIADESIFPYDPVPSTWIWGDMGNYYGAGAFGLNYNDNYFGVLLQSGKKDGDSVKIMYTSPRIEKIKLFNNLSSGGSGDNTIIYGNPYEYKRYLSGTIPVNKSDFRVKASLPDPPYYCALQLYTTLLGYHINVVDSPTTVRILKENNIAVNTNRVLLDTLNSFPLSQLVEVINIKSMNGYCEVLVKMLGLKYLGIASTSAGIQVIKDFCASQGMELEGLFMTDGSGLSLSNSISTGQMTTFLKSMAKSPVFFSFIKSLPTAGKTGSLSTMMKGTYAEGKLHAKSGTLTGTRAFAGYIESKNDGLLAFTIIANNYGYQGNDMKKRMEKIMILMAELDHD